MHRTILHCDMNNFYASVECMLDPSIRNYPVAVCGSVEERHGIVLAKNYKAKAYDIKTGEAVWQAKQKCKDLIVVPPHYEEYIKYSKLARSIYSRYTDQVEPYGMDECWLDISGTENIFGSPEYVANEIKETIKFELGLTISVGVSFNKVFAKLGSDMKKPDAITVITANDFKNQIWDLPASDMLGVGRATQKILNSYCINTIGELANTSPTFLKARLGKNGISLWQFANGNDCSRVLKTPKTVMSTRKIYLPITVAKMLRERKKQIEEMKDMYGDEFDDHNLVFCHSSGKPMEGQIINRALKKLIKEHNLPNVVFHSFRHASITYKLKWNGGDMKSVQGDSGHSRMDMVAEVYSHIIDEDRRFNAQRFEEQFYNAKGLNSISAGSKPPMPKFQSVTELENKEQDNCEDLIEKIKSNPDMLNLLKTLVGQI